MSLPIRYGRTAEEWGNLVSTGTAFLIDRARLNEITTYDEMNTALARLTGARPFEFARADERAAMRHLLGLIANVNLPASGLMVSALIQYLDGDDVGPGFVPFTEQVGLLQPGAADN